MPSNYGYFSSLPGRLKLAAIVVTAIDAILASIAHFTSEYTNNRDKYSSQFTKSEVRSLWREYYVMGVTYLCFICSIANLITYCVSLRIYWNRRAAIVDFLYHGLCVVLMGTSGMMMIISAVKIDEINCRGENGCQQWGLKLLSGALTMITALLYGTIGVLVLTNRKDVEREDFMDADQANK